MRCIQCSLVIFFVIRLVVKNPVVERCEFKHRVVRVAFGPESQYKNNRKTATNSIIIISSVATHPDPVVLGHGIRADPKSFFGGRGSR